MDSYGYPDDSELRAIREWDWHDIPALLEYVESLWRYPNYWQREGDWLYISTGGWSGNEDVIRALMDNTMFWLLCWYSSTRGGHYVFDLSRIPKRENT